MHRTKPTRPCAFPAAAATSPERFEKIGVFPRGANWLGGSSGSPVVAVRSSSLDGAVRWDFVSGLTTAEFQSHRKISMAPADRAALPRRAGVPLDLPIERRQHQHV